MKACETVVVVAVILCFGEAQGQDVSFGARLFHDKADCQFCHGLNGDGRGHPRSPGAAANPHETRLDREQLIERCWPMPTRFSETPDVHRRAWKRAGVAGGGMGAAAPYAGDRVPQYRIS
jgi:hypothetical protein